MTKMIIVDNDFDFDTAEAMYDNLDTIKKNLNLTIKSESAINDAVENFDMVVMNEDDDNIVVHLVFELKDEFKQLIDNDKKKYDSFIDSINYYRDFFAGNF